MQTSGGKPSPAHLQEPALLGAVSPPNPAPHHRRPQSQREPPRSGTAPPPAPRVPQGAPRLQTAAKSVVQEPEPRCKISRVWHCQEGNSSLFFFFFFFPPPTPVELRLSRLNAIEAVRGRVTGWKMRGAKEKTEHDVIDVCGEVKRAPVL